MNWTLVSLLSIPGLMMGLLAVRGLTREMLARTAVGPGGPSPRLMFLLMGPVIGLMTGLVLGGMCWMAGHVIKPVVPPT